MRRRKAASVRTALAIAAACIAAERGRAQTDWREVPLNEPCARVMAATAYDAARGQTVAFGGSIYGGALVTRTEIWDGIRWITPNLSVEPPARAGHAMAFDFTHLRTVLFGGSDQVGTLGDTWEWDGVAWLQRSGVGPAPRAQTVMAHDIQRGRTVLFGGLTSTGPTNDTWEWDGSSWIQRLPSHSPPAPTGNSPSMTMAYDVFRGRCVLCQFLITLSPSGSIRNAADVWEWDGIDWLHPGPLGRPSYRHDAGMAFDWGMGRTLLVGGSPSLASTPYAELWAWNGTVWQQISPAGGPLPTGRESPGVAYDVIRGRLVLFGGWNNGMLTDTWEWDRAVWEARTSRAPTHPIGAAAALDSDRGVGVLFGGSNNALSATNDTWQWQSGGWQPTSPLIRPPARQGASLTYDAARQRTVLFGGSDSTVPFADTWAWNGLDWAQGNPVNTPSARESAAMTYDAARQRVVLFGGRAWSPSMALQDTWVFDGTNWTQLTTPHTPSARSGAAFTFDTARARGVLFGGQDQLPYGDTWEWDGIDWTVQTPGAVVPPARVDAVLVFDPTRSRCVLGLGRSSSAVAFDDAWEWDGVVWQARNTATPRLLPRSGAAAFFDPVAHRTIVTGGVGALGRQLDDTWSYGPVQPASIAPFGTGCAGSAGFPALRANDALLPWLGDTLALAVEPAPANAPVLLAIGFSNTTFGGTSLPAPLDALGMTGCSLLVSIDEQRLAFANGTRADFALAVPATTALTGLQFFAQAAVADAAANPAGIVASNALAGRIGSK